jgi:hypothetical protein
LFHKKPYEIPGCDSVWGRHVHLRRRQHQQSARYKVMDSLPSISHFGVAANQPDYPVNLGFMG